MNKMNSLLILVLIFLTLSCSKLNSTSSDEKKSVASQSQMQTSNHQQNNNNNINNNNENSKNDLKQHQNWNVTYSQSGGIAGLMNSIKIDHTGTITSTDDKLQKSVSRKVSKNDINQLYKMLVAIETKKPGTPTAASTPATPSTQPTSPPGFNRSTCRDCIDSSLRVEFIKHIYTVNFKMMPTANNAYRKIANKILEINKKVLQTS